MSDYPNNISIENSLIGSKIIAFDEIGSTNTYLKERSLELPEGTVVFSRTQTAGRGRQGRSWLSDDGGIYMSILLRENLEQLKTRLQLYSFFPAIAVRNAVLDLFGIDCSFKWPNDVLIGRRKLCGILAEAQIVDDIASVIIGIGINVNASGFDGEISDKAISLRMCLGRELELSEFAEKLLSCLDDEYKKLQEDEDIVARYKPLCLTLGKEVKTVINGDEVTGFARDISRDGALVIAANDKSFFVSSGEVVVQGIY